MKFQGIDPWKSEDLSFRRRHLPHVETPDATYFISFACERPFKMPPSARSLVMDVIQACDGKLIDLDAAVVMPDHVHAMFRVIPPCTLSQILNRIKDGTAHRINQIAGHGGRVWTQESFDHVVRHDAEREQKIEYIRQNPVKNSLAVSPERYPWLYVK